MVMWVFGYGSLIWKAGFTFDDRLVGFIKDYRRVFYQGSTDHRGTPEYPGRTVTLEAAPGDVCWGVAYKVSRKEDEEIALTYLEVREKQYDKKEYVDFFTDTTASTPTISGVMVYIASPDKKVNQNYLGPAPLEEIAKNLELVTGVQVYELLAPSCQGSYIFSDREYCLCTSRQIVHAEGPSGPNRDYLFHLEKALIQLGCEDRHVIGLANEVRCILAEKEPTVS